MIWTTLAELYVLIHKQEPILRSHLIVNQIVFNNKKTVHKSHLNVNRTTLVMLYEPASAAQ